MRDSIYRFRPLNKYTFDELKKSYLYFSKIEQLNDPMEGFFRLFFSNEPIEVYENLFKHFLATMYVVQLDTALNNKETFRKDIAKNIFSSNLADILRHIDFNTWITSNIRQYIQDNIAEIAENDLKNILNRIYRDFYNNETPQSRIDKYIKQIKKFVINEVLTCSFSKTYESTLMWSHYADKHSGICIEFDDISEMQHISFNNNNNIKIKLRNVTYTKLDKQSVEHLRFSIGLAASNNSNKLNFLNQRLTLNGLQDIYDDKFEAIYSTKSIEWQYEQEARYLVLAKDLPEQKLRYNPQFVKSITFGINTTDEMKDEIKKVFSHNHNISFYEMQMDDNGVMIRKAIRRF